MHVCIYSRNSSVNTKYLFSHEPFRYYKYVKVFNVTEYIVTEMSYFHFFKKQKRTKLLIYTFKLCKYLLIYKQQILKCTLCVKN